MASLKRLVSQQYSGMRSLQGQLKSLWSVQEVQTLIPPARMQGQSLKLDQQRESMLEFFWYLLIHLCCCSSICQGWDGVLNPRMLTASSACAENEADWHISALALHAFQESGRSYFWTDK